MFLKHWLMNKFIKVEQWSDDGCRCVIGYIITTNWSIISYAPMSTHFIFLAVLVPEEKKEAANHRYTYLDAALSVVLYLRQYVCVSTTSERSRFVCEQIHLNWETNSLRMKSATTSLLLNLKLKLASYSPASCSSFVWSSFLFEFSCSTLTCAASGSRKCLLHHLK